MLYTVFTFSLSGQKKSCGLAEIESGLTYEEKADLKEHIEVIKGEIKAAEVRLKELEEFKCV